VLKLEHVGGQAASVRQRAPLRARCHSADALDQFPPTALSESRGSEPLRVPETPPPLLRAGALRSVIQAAAAAAAAARGGGDGGGDGGGGGGGSWRRTGEHELRNDS